MADGQQSLLLTALRTDMQTSLRSRKQDLVRSTIYEAAIDLFQAKGFDQTTTEEVAQAAGVSRRSFFRYYASKDDVLAQSTLHYGSALVEAVKNCPKGLPPLDALRKTVEAGVRFSESQQILNHKVIEIASRSVSARQAYMSRMIEVEDALTDAFAMRINKRSTHDMEPRLLSGIVLAIMNATLACWFLGGKKDISSSAQSIFTALARNLCPTATAPEIFFPARVESKTKQKRVSARV